MRADEGIGPYGMEGTYLPELILPQPSEKQKQFLTDEHKYIGYGGARGGGKSWAVRIKAVLLCLRYPGIKVMIIRKTYPELQENHIIPLCELLDCYADEGERIASYNDAKKHISFKNSSRILFRYCDTEKDTLRFQGTEVDVLFVDDRLAILKEAERKGIQVWHISSFLDWYIDRLPLDDKQSL